MEKFCQTDLMACIACYAFGGLNGLGTYAAICWGLSVAKPIIDFFLRRLEEMTSEQKYNGKKMG